MKENRICSKNKSSRVRKTSTCWASLWWQDRVTSQLDRGHQDLTWVSPGDAHFSTPALLHLPLTAWLKLPISDSTHLESLSYRNFLQGRPLVLCICHLFQRHDVADAGSTNVVRASDGPTVRTGCREVPNGVRASSLGSRSSQTTCLHMGHLVLMVPWADLKAGNSLTGVLHSINQCD